ncbi:hypothetical protein [Arvimicrobium flavum]|uniref:hypothetical protein n=1 Tax=Arvimicrobium flavum TaxID=3393320 RepID=UPI00237BE34A|nr:hypothetical protein [Mesorhizobium shangrilense]
MSLIDNLIPKRRGRPSKAVADANAAVERLSKDLDRLQAKREELASRYDEARASLDRAKEQRRAALASEPTADVTSLSRTVRDAEDQTQMYADALSDVENQISAVTAEREAQDLAGKREQVANHFEGIADAVDEAAAELEKAVTGLAKAFDKLKEAIPEDYALIEIEWPEYGRPGGPARPHELATVILAESLYRHKPEMFIEDRSRFSVHRFFEIDQTPTTKLWGELPMGADASAAAATLIGDRNRAHADAIRGGDVDLASGRRIEHAPEVEPEPKRPEHSEVEVFVTKDFRYVKNDSDFSCWETCSRRVKRWLPEPVANAAVEAGFVLRIDTPEGRDAYEADQNYRKTAMASWEGPKHFLDFEDLGDPLGFFEGKEIPMPKMLHATHQAA